MMDTKKRIANGVALGIGGLLLAACATTAPPAELVQARKSYDLAAANPTIIEHAPVDLFEAGKSVDRANAAFEAEADAEEVSHLAFLALKRVEIADAGARSRASQKEALRLKQLRERTRYDARSREAARAAQEAAQARAQVDSLVAASRYGAPVRSAQDDTALYEARLAQRELEISSANVERRLRDLESSTATGRQPSDAALLKQAKALQSLQAQQSEGGNPAAQQRALELQAANDAGETRLRALEEATTLAEKQSMELDAARQELAAATAATEPEALASEGAAADPFTAPSQTDRALDDLRAQRAESERRLKELQLAQAESEARASALRAERHALEQRAAETRLAGTESRPRVSAAPTADIERSTEIGESEISESEIAPAPSKPSIWRRMWNRISGRSSAE